MDVDSIKIAWESPQGQVTRYRVTYSSPEDGIHELLPAPGGEEDTAELHGLRPGSEYTINIVAIYDDMESLPLTGTQSTGTPLTARPAGRTAAASAPLGKVCCWCSALGKPRGQQRGCDCSERGGAGTGELAARRISLQHAGKTSWNEGADCRERRDVTLLAFSQSLSGLVMFSP